MTAIGEFEFSSLVPTSIVTPFVHFPVPWLNISPLGLVLEKELNKFRLIHHLSHPVGFLVNDGIDPDLCMVSYTSFESALAWVQTYVKGALLAKTDIEAAFYLLAVQLDSNRVLGFYWQSNILLTFVLQRAALFLAPILRH